MLGRQLRHQHIQHRLRLQARLAVKGLGILPYELLQGHRLAHARLGGQQRIQHPSARRLIDDLLQFVEHLPRHRVVDPALRSDANDAFGIGQQCRGAKLGLQVAQIRLAHDQSSTVPRSASVGIGTSAVSPVSSSTGWFEAASPPAGPPAPPARRR